MVDDLFFMSDKELEKKLKWRKYDQLMLEALCLEIQAENSNAKE